LILNGTSAQLGYTVYTVPYPLVNAGKYKREDKLRIQTILKLNTTPKKANSANTAKQNYSGSVAS